MNIPPDFHIQYSVLNFHLWLVLSRLEDFKEDKAVRYMIKSLLEQFRLYSNFQISEIHIKKKNDFIKDLESFMRLNRNTFDNHFKKNPKTSINPYYKVDALIWSTIFFEKIERYDERIYKFAEYAINQFNYFKTLSVEDIKDGCFNFDVYHLKSEYLEKITEINPPLSKEEFERELDSPQPIKKFFYTYDDPDYKMPLDVEKDQIIDMRFLRIQEAIARTYQKYRSLETYDYFSEQEDKLREKKEKEKKYIWKQKKKDLDMKLFVGDEIESLKKKIKEENSI